MGDIMPAPYDYTIQRPDIMGAIGAYEAGQDRRRAMDTQKKQDMFAQYLPGALKGDQAAIDQASQFATPDQQIQLSKIGPEKLQQAIQHAQAVTQIVGSVGDNDTQGFEAAKQRAIAMGLPQDQIAKLTIADLPRLRMQSGQMMQELEIEAKRLGLDVARANIRQSDAAAAASNRSGRGAGGIDNTTFDNMSGLRREFTAATKQYGDVRDAYGRIQASAKNPSAAGDLSLIFNYMKVLDPGSTVREGEFATAQNATGVPERIVNAYNSAISGQRLNPAQRNDFVNRAGLLFNRQHETYLSTKKNYDTLATKFGFDPSLVTFDQSGGITGPADAPPPQTAVPPPQQIQRPTIVGPGGQKMQLNAAGTAWEPVR